MTALAKCKDCKAITLDTEEDARGHREWHRDYDARLRNTRSAAIEARDALSGLRAEIKDLREAWDEAPDPIEPDQLVVTDMRDDDELGLTEPEPERVSQYADEDTDSGQPEPDQRNPVDDDDEDFDDEPAQATVNASSDPLRTYFAPGT